MNSRPDPSHTAIGGIILCCVCVLQCSSAPVVYNDQVNAYKNMIRTSIGMIRPLNADHDAALRENYSLKNAFETKGKSQVEVLHLLKKEDYKARVLALRAKIGESKGVVLDQVPIVKFNTIVSEFKATNAIIALTLSADEKAIRTEINEAADAEGKRWDRMVVGMAECAKPLPTSSFVPVGSLNHGAGTMLATAFNEECLIARETLYLTIEKIADDLEGLLEYDETLKRSRMIVGASGKAAVNLLAIANEPVSKVVSEGFGLFDKGFAYCMEVSRKKKAAAYINFVTRNRLVAWLYLTADKDARENIIPRLQDMHYENLETVIRYYNVNHAKLTTSDRVAILSKIDELTNAFERSITLQSQDVLPQLRKANAALWYVSGASVTQADLALEFPDDPQALDQIYKDVKLYKKKQALKTLEQSLDSVVSLSSLYREYRKATAKTSPDVDLDSWGTLMDLSDKDTALRKIIMKK